ncbi:MAG: calcium-binding protein [Sphingopyxis sp.]|uniref:calcium-binding protein n=1 Tax=Sphingopyxis sp. TaxID=1908224 RepID=UPI002ABCBC8D|nr:calcium-binding protein [Sphingopyxis sp.]MDZ3831382.1 calcium-binding protein [Sphingopyxis sp.]
MLKQVLLIGAAAISAPALAQATPASDDSSPPTEQVEPMAEPAPAEPASSDPVSAQPAPSGTTATPAQVAKIVESEFASYDGDANGDLDESEFAAWMKKLRAATEPGVDTESEAVKSWIGQAFGAADADKSGGVNKAELTSFLSRGA